MPLMKSKSKEAFKKNVQELINAFEAKGAIGNSKPKNKKAAIKQALAISYKMKRKGK